MLQEIDEILDAGSVIMLDEEEAIQLWKEKWTAICGEKVVKKV